MAQQTDPLPVFRGDPRPPTQSSGHRGVRDPIAVVTDTAFQRMIRESCEKEVGRIVEEEAAEAKRRVETRVIQMKTELAQRVLAKLKFSTEQSPQYGSVRMIVEF